MVRPISLRLRSEAIVSEARALIARVNEDALLRRQIKLAGFKALHATRKAYDLQEKFASRLSEVDRERWRERRKLVEAQLKRMAGIGHFMNFTDKITDNSIQWRERAAPVRSKRSLGLKEQPGDERRTESRDLERKLRDA
jgi:hypothetical protein